MKSPFFIGKSGKKGPTSYEISRLLSLARQGLAHDEGPASGVQLAGLAEEVASDAGATWCNSSMVTTWNTMGKFTMKINEMNHSLVI